MYKKGPVHHRRGLEGEIAPTSARRHLRRPTGGRLERLALESDNHHGMQNNLLPG
jgi:hypothetical protein